MTDTNRFYASAPTSEGLLFLAPAQIRLPRRGEPPRAEQNRIIRLAASVRRYGVLEPLCVRPAADENGLACYELVDGERRLRAACLVGLDRVPCRITRPDAAEIAKEAVFTRLRADKQNPFEEAEAFAALLRDHGMTQEEVARRLSLSQSAVANKIRLLQLTPAEREQILRAGLSERHARALLRVHDPIVRRQLLETVIREGSSVSRTEELVDRCLAEPAATRPVEVVETLSVEQASAEAAPVGVHKFAVRDLRPLYNSIDRTLAIFRKTGAQVTCTHREIEGAAEIVIRIVR